MPSALENLCGPNRPLKAEVSDAREFAGWCALPSLD